MKKSELLSLIAGQGEDIDIDTLLGDDYKVLRRLNLVSQLPAGYEIDNIRFFQGLYLDTETNGLNIEDEIINLAILPFVFDRETSSILSVDYSKALNIFIEPRKPLMSEVTQITGITMDMLKGHKFTEAHHQSIRDLLDESVLVLAHHADFDRQRVERIVPEFRAKPWGCTWSNIDWMSRGLSGKLELLCNQLGLFYDAHKAMADCEAGVAVLTHPDVPVFGELLENVRHLSYRLMTFDTKFDFKDLMKDRGYQWDGDMKSWFVKLENKEAVDDEAEWLVKNRVFKGVPQFRLYCQRATDRFSNREGEQIAYEYIKREPSFNF